ncbi:MAG: VOC family protein [Spirochaetales bacterium]|nr:VOC family protein [Spirochaetales bacterium]
MRIKSLSHVGITVKDFDKAVKWYWDVFKMPLLSVSELDAATLAGKKKLYNLKEGISVKLGFLRAPKGGVVEIFEFSETAPFDHAWNRPGTTHFTFDAHNAYKWYDKLKARGDVELLCEPQETDGAAWFFFRDPDGNLIEIIDLRFNYFAIRVLGKLVGFIMRKGPFKAYYK